MKSVILLFLTILLLTTNLSGQKQTMVVKFTGDTIYCDKITAGGKKIICETGSQNKIKLEAVKVKFYIEPYQMIMADGDPPLMRDTTRKCFVPADGKIHEVLMENDSFYVTGAMVTPILGRNIYEEYYIMDKNNVAVTKLDENKTIPDLLLRYFGGSCPEFDAKLKTAKPKFNNKIFPRQLWAGLISFYNASCKK